MQSLILNLVDIQYNKKIVNNTEKQHENISSQMAILEEYWSELDPLGTLFCHKNEFRDLLKSKKIVTRDSEVDRLIKDMIPNEF